MWVKAIQQARNDSKSKPRTKYRSRTNFLLNAPCRAYDARMNAPLESLEKELAAAVARHVPQLGLSGRALARGARDVSLSEAETALLCPNGPQDIAAILWRGFDGALENVSEDAKIRDRIRLLLVEWLDAATADEAVARRLLGYLHLPQHLGLYRRLLWDTADRVWQKAGDRALDENHYSKRAIVSGILATGLTTRLAQGRNAQNEQIERHIDHVMAFEKAKAKLNFHPEEGLVRLFETFGRLRFGTAR